MLGEIKASFLSEKDFKKTNGYNWVLSDGKLHMNSKYYKVTGKATPDLRGLFLRGKNYTRNTSTGNIEGDLPLNTYQGDNLVSHAHNIQDSGHSHDIITYQNDYNSTGPGEIIFPQMGFVYDGPNLTTWVLVSASPQISINLTVDKDNIISSTETTPRNVTVNFFIRID